MNSRCKPLLGTLVEVSHEENQSTNAIEQAFKAIKQVQDLMCFHDPLSELNRINRYAHIKPLEIHPWTAHVLKIAQEIYRHSSGLFNCGVGHRLVEAGLLPNNLDLSEHRLGGIEDIQFIGPNTIEAVKPVCLDLGGIAKGFAVDRAVEALIENGISSGCINAGGDLRVFGSSRAIQIRNPSAPQRLIDIGTLQNGAIATSALYFARRNQQRSHIINPLAKNANDIYVNFSESFSIIASECVYADALTKVLTLSRRLNHPCFDHFNAQAIKVTQ